MIIGAGSGKETEQHLATIDKARDVALSLGIGNKKSIDGLIREQRLLYRRVLLEDVTATFWLVIREATGNPIIKERFQERYGDPFSHNALWRIFDGPRVDQKNANLPIPLEFVEE